jgi:hypothetical protein
VAVGPQPRDERGGNQSVCAGHEHVHAATLTVFPTLAEGPSAVRAAKTATMTG